jgi:hypothetical protein
MKSLSLSLMALTLLLAPAASAHGIHAHIHVTGWAIEALPDSELRDFFQDPEVMNAALFGAAFTDSGYWPLSGEMGEVARTYSEHTHWEPFIRDVVTWIRDNDPPPWTSLESRKRAAFFMGCASHGMQDELFDSLFLHQVHDHDGGDQDGADPASDGFLILDGHLRFYPQPYMPMETLLTLYEVLDVEVTQTVIEAAVNKMIGVYVNDDFGPELARTIGESSKETLPWTYDHYMDETIPGSLLSEIPPTMGYIQAIWARLHGTFDPNTVVVGTYPAPGLRLLGIGADSPDSWVTFVYGAGVEREGPAHAWLDDAGAPVPFTRDGTRWGASWTRLHSLRPTQELPRGTWMTAQLPSATTLIDGATTTTPYEHLFQTPCEADDDPRCSDSATAEVEGDAGRSEGTGDTSSPSPDDDLTAPHADAGCHGGPTSGSLALLSLLVLLAIRRRDPTIATP